MTFRFFDDVIDGDDRRAVQSGERASLTQDPRPDRVPLGLGTGKRDEDLLHRHRALEELVFTAPDDTGATATDWRIQAITLGYISGCAVTR